MTGFEILLLAALAALIATPWFVGFFARTPAQFWSPLTMFAAVFGYYFLIGPLLALAIGETSAYGMDLRSVMWKPWLGGVLSLSAIYAGFAVPWIRFRSNLSTLVTLDRWRVIRWVCAALFFAGLVGFAYFAYAAGRSVLSILTPIKGNAEEVASGRGGIAAGNYLFLFVNAFIPAVCLWYVLNRHRRTFVRVLIVGLPVVLIAFFYITLGFRHRIVMLLAALSATVFLLERKRPSVPLVALVCAALVFISGLIVLSRDYTRGLDMSRLEGVSATELFLGGFNDSGTFFTLGLVMDSMPEKIPFVGVEPLWIAATIPVPRILWAGKPEPDYLWLVNTLSGTQGQAVPVVGEHYMMFGWVGIVMGGFLIGLLYRGFWNFYRANSGNPIVVVIYAVSWALCFPVINRGYLAQTLMEFFFALLPVVVLFLFFRRGFLLRPGEMVGHAAPVAAPHHGARSGWSGR